MEKAYELVVYDVADRESAIAARESIKAVLSTFPGYLGWRTLAAADGSAKLADVVTWRSIDEAKSAAKKVESDPAFAPFMAHVSGINLMGYFSEV